MSAIEKVAALAALINSLGCSPRIKLRHDATPEAWGNTGICIPVSGYIEVQGPWPFREVEWLEINPIVMKHIGRLVASKRWNHSDAIVSFLQTEGVGYSIVEGMIRISLDA
ncbi:hypothetical protein GCM10022409_08240 [Hymenobacter glaciei]|uniref:Uncharacterized protein n=1 Tax=Hymenobacter glaciei TaxID=877209 RepID=A0ABP7TI08_9BACT